MTEVCQLMHPIRRYIISPIERQTGSRRVVGRITWCLGIILQPRVPPNEGQSKQTSQNSHADPMEMSTQKPRKPPQKRTQTMQKSTPVEEHSCCYSPESLNTFEFGLCSDTGSESQKSPKP